MSQQSTNTSSSELTTFEIVANIIGVVAAVGAIAYIFKSIAKKTETRIISNDARRVLENKDEAKLLREAIDTYHVTGDWEKTKIDKIL
ncbi:hypothetical protein [Flagellimonas onchidii]|uniref:hypothetical protein n=1 Tax=Flagellimonas onchidii TaxID=2562684 RepID=UPI0010A69FB1|nr:hypothetical protein [Allomuricauda onchidii]